MYNLPPRIHCSHLIPSPIYSAAVTALAIEQSDSYIPAQLYFRSLTVDAQLAVPNNLLDLSLLFQIIQRLPCQASIDLQSVHKSCYCDEAVGLDVFVEFVGGCFIENDGVVGLVLD